MPTALKHKIEIMGAPSDAGVPGARLGPHALREAGLASDVHARGWPVHDAGNLHGMPVACLCGLGPPAQLRLIGARSVDPAASQAISAGREGVISASSSSAVIGRL